MPFTPEQRQNIRELELYRDSLEQIQSEFRQVIIQEKEIYERTKDVKSLQKVEDLWSANLILGFLTHTHKEFLDILQLSQSDPLAFAQFQALYNQLSLEPNTFIMGVHYFLRDKQLILDVLELEYWKQGKQFVGGMLVSAGIASFVLPAVVVGSLWFLLVVIPACIACFYCTHRSFKIEDQQRLLAGLKDNDREFQYYRIKNESEGLYLEERRREAKSKILDNLKPEAFVRLSFLGQNLKERIEERLKQAEEKHISTP